MRRDRTYNKGIYLKGTITSYVGYNFLCSNVELIVTYI